MFFEPVFCTALTMTEKWKKCLDSNGAYGALLTDLANAFDCLSHYLLIAKLHAYGFDNTSTEYLENYLSPRKRKIKTNKTFSNWTNILHRVPQGSTLAPLPLMFFFVICFCLYQTWT